MSPLRHYLLCALVAAGVAAVGIASVAMNLAMVWPGCAVLAFFGTSTALHLTRATGRRGGGAR